MKTMTRFTAILLAFILLLGGCDVTLEATPTPAPTPTPTPTPEPTVDSDGTVVLPPPDAQYDGPAVVMIEGPEDSAFGLVQETYYKENNPTAITLGEVVGDTDVLMPTELRTSHEAMREGAIELVCDATLPLAFTAIQYTNGELVDGGDMPKLETGGIVEKYGDGGTWTRHSLASLRTPSQVPVGFGQTPPDTGEPDIATLKDGRVWLTMPFTEPGVYRYTLYFRESIDHSAENLTTGDELYQISMIVIVPMSDKVYDLLGVGDLSEAPIFLGTYEGQQGYYIETYFRINVEDKWEAFNALWYNRTDAGTLERKVDGEWVEVEDAIPHEEPNEYGDIGEGGNPIREDFKYVNCTPRDIYFPELTGEYRLTLIYSNDYDENFELVLHFNFDE